MGAAKGKGQANFLLSAESTWPARLYLRTLGSWTPAEIKSQMPKGLRHLVALLMLHFIILKARGMSQDTIFNNKNSLQDTASFLVSVFYYMWVVGQPSLFAEKERKGRFPIRVPLISFSFHSLGEKLVTLEEAGKLLCKHCQPVRFRWWLGGWGAAFLDFLDHFPSPFLQPLCSVKPTLLFICPATDAVFRNVPPGGKTPSSNGPLNTV